LSIRTYWQEYAVDRLWSAIEKRYSALDSELRPELRLIKRNVDRESALRDIRPEIWTEFIREMMAGDLPEDWCACTDAVLERRRKYYFMPGRRIEFDVPSRLFHYMRLGRFQKDLLKEFAITDTARLAELITANQISGKNLERRILIRAGHVVWVTDDSLSATTNADEVRNALGLRHIDNLGDRLIELNYPSGSIGPSGLRAPTVLDAAWQGTAQSWVFTKRSKGSDSEADWGRTLNMTPDKSTGSGHREAVHEPFAVTQDIAPEIQLRVLDPLTEPLPSLNIQELESL
jgi:hypothetical protein